MQCCYLVMKIKQSLASTGGATESVFPQIDALLGGETDYWEALEYVAARKKMDRYRSIMDFLFCELHPEWQMPCRRYYAGNGPQLREQITAVQLKKYNERLLAALEVAHESITQKRRESWGAYRGRVEIRLAA